MTSFLGFQVSTHLFHYASHTQQKLISKLGVGKHILQKNRSNMVFTIVTKISENNLLRKDLHHIASF